MEVVRRLVVIQSRFVVVQRFFVGGQYLVRAVDVVRKLVGAVGREPVLDQLCAQVARVRDDGPVAAQHFEAR
jgi:hypothetical protein